MDFNGITAAFTFAWFTGGLYYLAYTSLPWIRGYNTIPLMVGVLLVGTSVVYLQTRNPR